MFKPFKSFLSISFKNIIFSCIYFQQIGWGEVSCLKKKKIICYNFVCVCIYINKIVYVCVYTHTHTHTHSHTHTLTYITSHADMLNMTACCPGLISVIGEIDYEEKPNYELTLRATDTDTGSYTEALIFVNLQVQ